MEGEIPAERVAETDEVLVISDINPQAPHHYLAFPKQHIEVFSKVPGVARSLFECIEAAVKKRDLESLGGFRIVMNLGKAAGQEVEHIHFHLLAGRPFQWPPG